MAEPAVMTAVPRPEAAEWRPCRVAALDAKSAAGWGDYLQAHEEATLFHTIAWRDAVKASFGHEDLYFVALRGERIVGVLPLFLIRSLVAGRMLVSVPCGVGGGVLADDEEVAGALFQVARDHAVRLHCSCIDLRSERACLPGVPIVDRYVSFRRELPHLAKDVLGWLPRKSRAAARNARDKFGLTVSFDDEHLAEVWRLYSISMRRLGSLNYPYHFFERLVERTPDRHWVSVVRQKDRTVAGLVTFCFKDRVMPYFFGSTQEARRCSAANFAYLTVMQRAVDEGYRVFDFGRSRHDNSGSFNFKRFHGFEPKPLAYQMYHAPDRAAPNLSPENPRFRLARRIWPHLPLGVTRVAGALLTKHIPG